LANKQNQHQFIRTGTREGKEEKGEGRKKILWQQEMRREKINQERGMKSVEEHKMNSRAEGGGNGGEARLWEEEAG
jgi:hypothetical protein